jgi:hypothetical protein
MPKTTSFFSFLSQFYYVHCWSVGGDWGGCCHVTAMAAIVETLIVVDPASRSGGTRAKPAIELGFIKEGKTVVKQLIYAKGGSRLTWILVMFKLTSRFFTFDCE